MNTYESDVLIVGSGPAGIFSVFELGLHGLSTIVLDTLPTIGGQCTKFYPTKPIYDIPAYPEIKGKQLIDQLWLQAKPFKPQMLLEERIQSIFPGFSVITESGKHIKVKFIVMAVGAGSFLPITLNVPHVQDYESRSLFYNVKDPTLWKGKRVAVLGGGDSALDWAFLLESVGALVTIIHRSKNFRASSSLIQKLMDKLQAKCIDMCIGKVTALNGNIEAGKITSIGVEGDEMHTIPVDRLLVSYGFQVKKVTLSGLDLAYTQGRIDVSPESFETNVSGVYGVGDCIHYPGKLRLILSGFYEVASMATHIHNTLAGKVVIQRHTTSDTRLKEILEKKS